MGRLAVIVAVMMMAGACASSTTPTASLENGAGDDASSTTELAITTVPSTVEASTTTTVDDAPASEIEATAHGLPAGVQVEAIAVGDAIVAAAWMEGVGQVLFRVGDPISEATVVADLFAADAGHTFVAISDVVWLDGRAFAFVMGDERGADLAPTVLVSDDGATWTRATPTVVSSSRRAPTTPDSPPYPGPSAVVDATVDDGHLFATGWATIDGTIRAVVWDSTDGERWRLEALPDQGTGTEFGMAVGRSDAGTVVRIGGTFHSGVATVTSTTRGEWVVAANPNLDAVATQVGANDTWFYELVPSLTGSATLHVSSDGSTWTSTEVPDGEGAASIPRLAVAGSHDPIVVTDSVFTGHDSVPMRAWTFDRGEWSVQRLPGTRLVTADACHLVTTESGTLFVSERAAVGSC